MPKKRERVLLVDARKVGIPRTARLNSAGATRAKNARKQNRDIKVCIELLPEQYENLLFIARRREITVRDLVLDCVREQLGRV